MAAGTRHLLLDYGQVISTPQDPADLAELAALAGLAPDAFAARYWPPRLAYDQGGPERDYWGAVCGTAPDERLLRRLVELDTRSWLRLDPDVLAVLDGFHTAGIPVSLLSNAPRALAAALVGNPALDRFAHLLFSAELDLVKPDPRIFAVAADRLGAPASDIVFVDDRPENVRAAAAVGMHAVVYTGSAACLRGLPLHG